MYLPPFLKNSIPYIPVSTDTRSLPADKGRVRPVEFIFQFKSTTMFYKLKKTLVAAALLPLALGCKRESLNEQNTSPTSTPTHKVQQWLNGQSAPKGTAASRVPGSTMPKNALQWGQATFNKNSATHFIPASLAQEAPGNPYARAGLVATEDAQGQVTAGHYMVVVPNRQKMGDAAAKYYNLARLYQPQPQEQPTGFSGAVLYYNTAGLPTASRVYNNGQPQQGTTAALAAKPQPAGSDANKVQRNCDGPGSEGCIDWYYQTFVNGTLVYEEYLFTTCCGGISGGGSGNGITDNGACATTCNNAATLASEVTGGALNTYSVSSGAELAPNALGIIRKPKTLTINYYKLSFFWGYYAHCSAIYTGVVYKLNKDDLNWKWESLRYDGTGITDGTIPPCTEVVPTVTPAPVVFSADRLYASIDFAFNVKAFFTCGTPYAVHNYSSTNPGAGLPYYAND
jgi:hypothetical protein